MGRIVAAGKSVSGLIAWEYETGERRRWAICSAAVGNPTGWELRLYGRAQVAHPYKRSYSLIWTLGDMGYRIFALDVNGRGVTQLMRSWTPAFDFCRSVEIPRLRSE